MLAVGLGPRAAAGAGQCSYTDDILVISVLFASRSKPRESNSGMCTRRHQIPWNCQERHETIRVPKPRCCMQMIPPCWLQMILPYANETGA